MSEIGQAAVAALNSLPEQWKVGEGFHPPKPPYKNKVSFVGLNPPPQNSAYILIIIQHQMADMAGHAKSAGSAIILLASVEKHFAIQKLSTWSRQHSLYFFTHNWSEYLF